MYAALGRKEPWEDDSNPPKENPDQRQVEDLIGFKKVEQVSLVRPAKGETEEYLTFEYGNEEYAVIPEEDAYQENAWSLFIESAIYGSDLPIGRYRQVGLYTGIQSDKEVLLPEEVEENQGTLQFLTNRKPQRRTKNVDVYLNYLVTFKNDKQLIQSVQSIS